jgi:hypothetical protein
MMGGAKAHSDGIVAFSQTDFTEDLKKIVVTASARRAANIREKNAALKSIDDLRCPEPQWIADTLLRTRTACGTRWGRRVP